MRIKHLKIYFLFSLIFLSSVLSGLAFLLKGIQDNDSTVVDQISEPGANNFHIAESITSYDGKIAGTGLPVSVTLNCNKSGGAIYKTSNASLPVSVPVPWTIMYTNITVKDVAQDSDIVIMEDSITADFNDIKNNIYGMQFNVSSYSLLETFSIYINNELKRVNSLIVHIYNATLQVSDPAPDIELYREDYGALANAAIPKWHNFTFSSTVELDPSNTYGNAFFIVLNNTVGVGGKFEWGYESDAVGDGDNGAAYKLNGFWTIQGWDFDLKVGLINLTRSPSEIDLKINGTSVGDKGGNNGEWISTSVYSDISGSVSFQFSANITAHFLVEWFVSYNSTANQAVNTYFEGFDTDEIIYWNATYGATFIFDSFDNQLDFDLPIWDSIINVRKNQSIHSQWNSSIVGSIRKVTIRNAENALWTIQCNDTNYVESVYAKRSGFIVSEVNGTDTIEIFGNFTEILTSGDANLTIFPLGANYHDTEGEIVTNNKTIKFSPAWELMNTSTASYTEARLQVSWFNGTAAGINTTTLIVSNIPTNITYLNHTTSIQSGESIFAYVNFSSEYTGEGLAGANLLVKNSTDNTTWPAPFSIINDYLNGKYKIEILSLGVGSGVHYFSINLSKPLYRSSEISNLNVTITVPIVSNISVTAPNCVGLDFINQSYALANPAPYHNSTVKVSIYYFSNMTLEHLSNGIITPLWIGDGPEVSWVPAFFGYYNITIDVTGFHSGTNHTLKISIQEIGYAAAVLYIIVPIRKLPTTIQPFESSYAKYLEETFIVYAIFQDIRNEQPIPSIYELNGNFTIKIGNLVDNMTLLISGIGIYIYELTLSTLGLEEGNTYNITLSAFSSEHEFALINISLYVIPKAAVDLKLIGVPAYVLAGTQIRIFANLTLIDGTPIYSTPLIFTVRYEFQNTSQELQNTYLTNSSGIAESLIDVNPFMDSIQIKVEYQGNMTIQNKSIISTIIPIITLNCFLTLGHLPEEIMVGETLEISATLIINGTPAINKTLTFKFMYDGEFSGDQRTAFTGLTGTAVLSFTAPTGVTKIKVEVSYDGLSYETDNSTTAEIAVISIGALIWRYSYIWLPAILLTLAVVVGSYLNKRIIRLTKFQKEIRRVKERIYKKMRIGKVPQPTREALITELFEKQISNFKGKNRKN